jgi:uncharacterized SAM-binding protein YcdF (DUF218 family)
VLRGGRPSGTLRARTLHAASLYLSGAVDLLVVTGGVGEHPPSEAEVMARLLVGAGVPEERILKEDRARSTRESARLVTELLARLPDGERREVVIVTDPLHCVRTVRAFWAAGMEVAASPAYESPQWTVARRRRAQFLRELGAYVWYWLREPRPRAKDGGRDH